MSRRADPAPSRAHYKLQRLMLRASVKRLIRFGPPALLVVVIASVFALSPSARSWVAGGVADARAALADREEFRVTSVAVTGASPELVAMVEGLAEGKVPASSLDLDLKELKTRVEGLPQVAEAAVRIGAGGVLQIALSEREPQFVWRAGNRLYLLDASGVTLGEILSRADRPKLPLVIGPGADARLEEARLLLAAAEPVMERVRGLQRVGGRRWNVVLDRDQILMLPEEAPLAAFRRIMALARETDILNRDVMAVDFRDTGRPTLRMGTYAASELRSLQAQRRGESQ